MTSEEKYTSIILVGGTAEEKDRFQQWADVDRDRSIQLTIASDAEQAAEQLNEQQPDLCFVFNTPDTLDGLTFIRNNSLIHPETGFVLLVEILDEDHEYRAIQSGAQDVIRKSDLTDHVLDRAVRYIAQKSRHEKYLRGQRQAMSQILNSIGEIFWIYDFDRNHFSEVDRHISLLLGTTHEDFLQNPDVWMQHIHAEDRDNRRKLFDPHMDRHVQKSCTYRLRSRAGDWCVMQERVIRRIGPNGEDWLIGVTRDITKKQKNERQLRLLERVIQQAEEAVLITDTDLHSENGPQIIYVNEAFCRMTGYEMEEVIGRTPRILQGPQTDRAVLAQLKDALEHEEEFRAEAINYRKDGTTYWVRWSISPIYDNNGKLIYFASIQNNIDQERIEQELRGRDERLRSLGNLVGDVAHDLNNILSPILMTAGFLQLESEDESIRKHAETLATSSKRASEVVSKLLTFARGGEKETTLVNAADMVSEVYGIAKETFPSNLRIDIHQEGEEWPVSCNPSEMQQVLLNLAINAKDSMKANGGALTFTIRGRTLSAKEARLFMGDAKAGPHMCIAVQDTGHGIDPEDFEAIFEPFHTTKPEGEGTGLGLASALGILRAHEGALEVESEPGKGSTFTIYLPASPEKTVEENEQTQELRTGSGQRLLVVDDELMIVETVCNMLESQGYKTKGVTSSQEAVKLFRSESDSFHAVITDLMMPDHNGLELIKEVREIKPDIPVLVMSGYAWHELLEEMKHMGIRNSIQKPVRMDDLLEAIHDMFQIAT